ncbi:MAG: Ldh family oxidoreductase [Candidatus Tectomicrobia bacterium]|nr:Ldh family oxidoreductase [Candidatus Tectomicrobia bacterium]
MALEQFHILEEDAIRVKHENLKQTVVNLFVRMNVPEDDAQLGADCLVTADLRGVDSHGVSNMLRYYINGYTTGTINPKPQWRIVREAPAAATIDCDKGLGIIIAPKAMDLATKKAKETGVGAVAMANGRHLGMASYHAMRALTHDMIGMCMTATGASVLPTFGREPRLGTNPVAYAVPAKEMAPFVMDWATSVVAGNKLGIGRRLGATIPGNWIARKDGTIVTEPGPIPERSMPPNAEFYILPFGGTREMGSHKGYGLAALVEILCGILSGGGFAMIRERGNARHFVSAYNVANFIPVDEFKQMMDDFLRSLASTPPAPGYDRVVYPGQLEAEEAAERQTKGIPLHKEVIQWLEDISKELSLPFILV